MSIERCICGDSECRTCGVAQGTRHQVTHGRKVRAFIDASRAGDIAKANDLWQQMTRAERGQVQAFTGTKPLVRR